MSGGTLQLLSTNTVHISRTRQPYGKTLCGKKYRIGATSWIWSYNDHAKTDCARCLRSWR